MLIINSLTIQGRDFIAIVIELPKMKLFFVTNEIGFISCAATNLEEVTAVAGQVNNVISIEQLLDERLINITESSEKYGWTIGMKSRDALLYIS